ncbi:MAG: sensor histidine kinase [Verrucomicrobiota bacterium]
MARQTPERIRRLTAQDSLEASPTSPVKRVFQILWLVTAFALSIKSGCAQAPSPANLPENEEGKLPASELIPGLTSEKETNGAQRGKPIQITQEIIPGITRAQESALLPILTSTEQVRKLTADQAAQGYVVKISGVVTMSAPGTAQTYIQDASGGLYIGQAGQTPIQQELYPGQLVEILGKTVRGRFSRHVNIDPNYTGAIDIIGEAELPKPLELTGESLSDPKNDAQWSELTGVVRRVKPRLYFGKPWAAITLSSGNTRFEAMCFLTEKNASPDVLLGAEVRLRGVPSPLISERGQLSGHYLLISSPSDITVLRPPDPNAFAEPIRTIDSLPRLEIGQTSSPRVHVRGIVSFVIPDRGFYLYDGTASIRVEQADHLPTIGAEVSVLGFAEWGDWSPILQDSTITATGKQAPLQPEPLDANQLASGDYDGALIQTDALLLRVARSATGPLLVLQSEGRVFEARFVTVPDNQDLLKLPEQSRIRMNGLVVYQKPPDWKDQWSIGARRTTNQAVPFELWLASSDEIQIISKPSWWNKTRITIALSALGVITLAALAWIHTLRSQVELLTEVNSAQRVREATFDERTRVARELHDSVEQELAGLTIQLDAVRARLNSAPESAAAAVETARAMLRHTREEARRSIWDLRSIVLERGDLASALTEVATDPGGNGPENIRLELNGTPVRLAPKVELNLVRICQEAASNARKYARATEVVVRLNYSGDTLTLSVSDDGCGFDASNTSAIRLGHFGLLHMRERAEQIGADFTIRSSIGNGTTVTAQLSISKSLPTSTT